MKRKLALFLAVMCLALCFPAGALALSDMTLDKGTSLAAVTVGGTALPDAWVSIKVTDKNQSILYFSGQKTGTDAAYSFVMDLSGETLPLDVTLTYGDVVETAQIKWKDSGGTGGGGGGGNGEGSGETPGSTDPPEGQGDPNGQGKPAAFTDISGHWAEEIIRSLAERGVVTGRSEALFDPQGTVTRAEFLAMLVRTLDEEDLTKAKTASFSDVKATDWFAPYVNWAVEKGVAEGFGNGEFGPHRLITREQMAAMADRFAKVAGGTLPADVEKTVFKDQARISPWAVDAVSRVQQAGILSGNPDGTFRPQDNGTRAEAAAIVKRLMEKLGL